MSSNNNIVDDNKFTNIANKDLVNYYYYKLGENNTRILDDNIRLLYNLDLDRRERKILGS